MKMNPQSAVTSLFDETLRSVSPLAITGLYAGQIQEYMRQKNYAGCLLIGFGKASYHMALAVAREFCGVKISGGVVITKYGHAGIPGDECSSAKDYLSQVQVYEAGHPIPDEQGVRATGEVIRLLDQADGKSLVVCLISGGGSALLVSPYPGITLAEKQQVTDLLLRSGADISELNAVRKHISRIKGGRLAERAAPAEVISLMISDVIGDPLDVIASGPTAPDTSTYQDAMDVIRKYHIGEKVPCRVIDILNEGIRGGIPETPKEINPLFRRVRNIVIASNKRAIETARDAAIRMDMEPIILSCEISGEAREAGRWLAEKAMAVKAERQGGTGGGQQQRKKPVCLISGGETTVTVKGNGKGGRNTELAMSFAMAVRGEEGMTLLSAGTDGTDGPTDAAGAIVDGNTIIRAEGSGLKPLEYLDNNDSYNFFKQMDSLLITGPTGTNVMDIQLIIIEL